MLVKLNIVSECQEEEGFFACPSHALTTYIWVNFEALLTELAIGEELALLLRMIVWAC